MHQRGSIISFFAILRSLAALCSEVLGLARTLYKFVLTARELSSSFEQLE